MSELARPLLESVPVRARSREMKKFAIQLWGGLGNQLFQIAAARALSVKHGASFNVDSSWPDLSRRDNTSGLRHRLKRIPQETWLPRKLDPVSVYKYLRSSKLPSNRLHMRGQSEVLELRAGAQGISKEILNQTHTLVGFFDNSWGLETIAETNSKIEISYTERDVRNATQAAGSDPLSLSYTTIHLRRGDYRKDSSTFGLLDFQFYKKAIQLIQCEQPVLVLSDDTDEAAKLTKFLGLRDAVILGSDTLTKFETLFLMENADTAIMANSTFSWWGAMLGNQDKQILAPDPWYRGGSNKAPGVRVTHVSHNW
jgi:hypothetical protein